LIYQAAWGHAKLRTRERLKSGLYPHAKAREFERAAKETEVTVNIKEGERVAAKYGRTGYGRNYGSRKVIADFLMFLRLDRLLTLYFMGPIGKRFFSQKGVRIPILMYHSISDEKEKGHPYFWINTSPDRFAEQMKFLHDNGYKVISLSSAVDLITQNLEAPIAELSVPESDNRNPHSNFLSPTTHHPSSSYVVLTFDDGYQDFYTHAFRMLKQYEFTATVYLPTAFIGDSKTGLKGKKHLKWGEIRELQSKGIEFGSHTVNHPQLYDLEWKKIEFELKSSKKVIEDNTGQEAKSFSYPYKFPEQDDQFINKIKNSCQSAGYKNGVNTRIGTIHKGNEFFF
jgi:peptidoglycan/xylan/chitin deacetylase (PgdA/CDA1 family)